MVTCTFTSTFEHTLTLAPTIMVRIEGRELYAEGLTPAARYESHAWWVSDKCYTRLSFEERVCINLIHPQFRLIATAQEAGFISGYLHTATRILVKYDEQREQWTDAVTGKHYTSITIISSPVAARP